MSETMSLCSQSKFTKYRRFVVTQVSILTGFRYCKRFRFAQLAARNKLIIKDENTIVKKWPLALKLKKGDAGFDDEFAMLFASGNWGAETYVEWTGAD